MPRKASSLPELHVPLLIAVAAIGSVFEAPPCVPVSVKLAGMPESLVGTRTSTIKSVPVVGPGELENVKCGNESVVGEFGTLFMHGAVGKTQITCKVGCAATGLASKAHRPVAVRAVTV